MGTDQPIVALRARFAVHDLSVKIFCEEHDESGQPEVAHPLPLVSLWADFHAIGFGERPFDFERWSRRAQAPGPVKPRGGQRLRQRG